MGRLQVDDELTGQLGQTCFYGDICVLVCSRLQLSDSQVMT